MFVYTLNRQKLRRIRRREGRYLLRTNLTENDPALLWQYYTQLRSKAWDDVSMDLRSAAPASSGRPVGPAKQPDSNQVNRCPDAP